MPVLNDVHSRLNATDMVGVVAPDSPAGVSSAILEAREAGVPLCPAGSRHSMGGQQFLNRGVSLSSEGLRRIGPLDRGSGTVWVQSGVAWPALVEWLHEQQPTGPQQLSIIQKQTGADGLSLAGALSSNIHGRVLGRRPIVDDVEAFHITTADGTRVLCSRHDNPGLFRLAIGGYGLFGFIDDIKLRLQERQLLARRVRETSLENVVPDLEEQTRQGATYGDFQFRTDESSDKFMAEGIMSTYTPVSREGIPPADQLGLSAEDWSKLYVLAHTDKPRAYEEYRNHYFQTDGQLYWSDEHQFSPYLPEAGDLLYQSMGRSLGWNTYASLMISELYVPRLRFVEFMEAARKSLLADHANLIYGTVRLIEAETETLLRWAQKDYACVIFNLLVEHSPEGIDRGRARFRALIDCALAEGGCYYLTYHRWARKDQVEQAYPEFREFLHLKELHDPGGVFASDWYNHHRDMFA